MQEGIFGLEIALEHLQGNRAFRPHFGSRTISNKKRLLTLRHCLTTALPLVG
jgi:hypothetical protein